MGVRARCPTEDRTMSSRHLHALEYALDENEVRGSRSLTLTAIRLADRAMRSILSELADQSNCAVDDLNLDGWYESATNHCDSETCRAIEWYWRRADIIRTDFRAAHAK